MYSYKINLVMRYSIKGCVCNLQDYICSFKRLLVNI